LPCAAAAPHPTAECRLNSRRRNAGFIAPAIFYLWCAFFSTHAPAGAAVVDSLNPLVISGLFVDSAHVLLSITGFASIPTEEDLRHAVIRYTLPYADVDEIRFTVHTLHGRPVWSQKLSRVFQPGYNVIVWNGNTSTGESAAAGMYIT